MSANNTKPPVVSHLLVAGLLVLFAGVLGRSLFGGEDIPVESGFDSVVTLPLQDTTGATTAWEAPETDRNPFDQHRTAVVVPSVDDDEATELIGEESVLDDEPDLADDPADE